jgi:phosphatidylethanolamine/phosphatidyl-N-methylethanolamine N-methyltransferase
LKPAQARFSYTLFAPLYDYVVGPLLQGARRASLARLPDHGCSKVLIDGIGTGLDLPWLPAGHRYVGIDLTPAMLDKARRRRNALDLALIEGDVRSLPFVDSAFDHVVMHLILAVVSDPVSALAEAARVLKPRGTMLVLDKFLRRGERASARRLLSPLAGRVATRLDVVFEDVLEKVSGLHVVNDEPALLRGWFRRIELRKTA